MHRVSFRQVSASVLVLFFLLSQTGVVAFAQSLPQREDADIFEIKFDVQEVKTKPEEAAVKLVKLSDLGLSTKLVHEQSFNWSNWCFGDFFQNLRDDRTEVFRDDVTPGYYRYSYMARATTSGHFIAPAASVEEMYEPETFGHSDSFYVDVVSDGDE